MDGKVCVVTGATSGIGTETARELARRGAQVVIVARNAAKAAATVDDLRSTVPGASVDVVLADLALLAEVRRLARALADRFDHLDVLINNAGVNHSRQVITDEGFDAMLATNYFAPFLLSNLLLETMQKSAPSRIVNVASEAHRFAGRADVESLTRFGPYRLGNFGPYGKTKLALILFTQELAERLGGTGVTANSLCPGMVATNLPGETNWATRLGPYAAKTPLVATPAQGARMTVKAASDPDLEAMTGAFFTSTLGARFVPRVSARSDRVLQASLWARTAEIVGLDAN